VHKAILIWVNPCIGFGQYFGNQTEQVLFAKATLRFDAITSPPSSRHPRAAIAKSLGAFTRSFAKPPVPLPAKRFSAILVPTS
jgi:hypothetical protein